MTVYYSLKSKITKSLVFFSLLSLFFFILFVKLSIWQYNRSFEKTDMLQKLDYAVKRLSNKNQKIPTQILNLNELNELKEYSLVTLEGHFNFNDTILLTNKTHEHQQGYHVITPFITNNYAVLIDRGFIGKQQSLQINKNPALQSEKIILSGIIRKSNTSQYILGNNILDINESGHRLIQRIDLSKNTNNSLNKLFKYQLSNNYIDLLAPAKLGFITNKQWSVISPEKHLGYSLTWLALAISIVFLYGYFCYTIVKNK